MQYPPCARMLRARQIERGYAGESTLDVQPTPLHSNIFAYYFVPQELSAYSAAQQISVFRASLLQGSLFQNSEIQYHNWFYTMKQ